MFLINQGYDGRGGDKEYNQVSTASLDTSSVLVIYSTRHQILNIFFYHCFVIALHSPTYCWLRFPFWGAG